MKPVYSILLIGLLALSTGCTTIVESVNKDPITLKTNERTWGSWVDDQTIETISKVNINKADQAFKTKSRVKIVSFNGIVLLLGQVPSDDLKDLAGSTIKDIEHVRQVYNELEISEPASILQQSNDTWLTTKIKTSLITTEQIPADQIKINTEKGTVYLMGLVTPKTAQDAVKMVADTHGVQRVVKVFEYIKN